MKINPEREDYLVAIFKLSETKKNITNKILSEWMNFAPSSISEMLKKLRKDGLVSNSKEIKLTDVGVKKAKEIISKHRLWEYFMTVKLGCDWRDVHETAEKFQSIANDEFYEKLNEFLGYPEYCPHGSIIYLNNEESTEKFIKLSEAEIDKEYIIRRVRDDRDLLNYLDGINIKIGQKIKILDFDNFDETVFISIDEKDLRVSPKASVDIYLKLIK